MRGLRLWLARSAFFSSRRGFGLGLAVLSLPCFVAASQGHFHFLPTPQFQQDGVTVVTVALLGSGLLFVIGSLAFPFLKSVSATLGRTMGACLVRFAIMIVAEVSFVFLAYLGLYFLMPIAVGVVLSLIHMENYFVFVFIGMADSFLFSTWERSVGDLFVPALVIMVFWTETYFGLLGPPTDV